MALSSRLRPRARGRQIAGSSGFPYTGPDAEPSTITDFDGFAAVAYVAGEATGSDGKTYLLETDIRALKAGDEPTGEAADKALDDGRAPTKLTAKRFLAERTGVQFWGCGGAGAPASRGGRAIAREMAVRERACIGCLGVKRPLAGGNCGAA